MTIADMFAILLFILSGWSIWYKSPKTKRRIEQQKRIIISRKKRGLGI